MNVVLEPGEIQIVSESQAEAEVGQVPNQIREQTIRIYQVRLFSPGNRQFSLALLAEPAFGTSQRINSYQLVALLACSVDSVDSLEVL